LSAEGYSGAGDGASDRTVRDEERYGWYCKGEQLKGKDWESRFVARFRGKKIS